MRHADAPRQSLTKVQPDPMTRQTSSSCMCRIPVDEAAIPGFSTGDELAEWCRAHGVTIEPDHLGRPSVDVPTAYRLRAESDAQSERAVLAMQEARTAHAAAVAELRDAVTSAFLEHTGGAAVLSPDGILTVAERKAAQVAAGLDAARAVWHAAPFAVATEVHQLSVSEGDVTMSYDLNVVLPRATLEDGVTRAVARANRAARV